MKLTPLDDVLDKHFGKVGTPKRDAFESDVDEALHAYRLGEAIKKSSYRTELNPRAIGRTYWSEKSSDFSIGKRV